MAATKKTTAPEEDVRRLAFLFEGFRQSHGTHGAPDRDPEGLKWNIKRSARTLHTPPTLNMWTQHVRGERPLGIIPIREDNTCGWGSIDYDVYDVNLVDVVGEVLKSKLPLVPCVSKSGGLHLFLFLKEPESAADVQSVLRDAAASLGMAGSEIFPKQTKVLLERGDRGNWMVMPYYGDTFSGKLRWQHGVKKTGAEMTLREFVTYAEERRTTVAEFSALCEARRVPPPADEPDGKGGGKRRKSRADFRDGPPCLQHLTTAGVQSDGRKRTLFMMALYYKRADEEGWKKRLEQANQEYFKTPLPSEEVLGIIRSCEKKEYEYTCKEEPMRGHCDSILCRTRRFGVGRGGQYPVITGIRKLETEPPLWFVDVEGECLELSTDELQNYHRFQRACMEKVNRMFAPLKHEVWTSVLAEALEKMVPVPAPPEISVDGRFRMLLTEFLTNRSRGERFEDLYSGRPWENVEEKRHYFVLRHFEKFLAQEKFEPHLTTPQITQRIRRMDGASHYFNRMKPGIRTFYVPSSVVEAPPEIEPQKLEDEDL